MKRALVKTSNASVIRQNKIADILYRVSAICVYAFIFGAVCSLLASCWVWLDMRVHSSYYYWAGLVISLFRTRYQKWGIDIILGQLVCILIMFLTQNWARPFYDLREVVMADMPVDSYRLFALVALVVLQLYLLIYWWVHKSSRDYK